jgi:hypothetical protein
MLFGLVRMVFIIILLVVFLLIMRILNITITKKKLIIIIIVAMVMYTVSCFVPIENAFIKFSSAESSYEYMQTATIQEVIQGENTSLVLGEKWNEELPVTSIIPKSDDGWKLGMAADLKMRGVIIIDGIELFLVQYKDTDEYYIRVKDDNKSKLRISDSMNSEFVCYTKSDTEQKEIRYLYYAFLNNLVEEYSLTVNDKLIEVDLAKLEQMLE